MTRVVIDIPDKYAKIFSFTCMGVEDMDDCVATNTTVGAVAVTEHNYVKISDDGRTTGRKKIEELDNVPLSRYQDLQKRHDDCYDALMKEREKVQELKEEIRRLKDRG